MDLLKNQNYVHIDSNYCNYSSTSSEKGNYYTKNDVFYIICSLLDISFVNYAGSVYQQKFGIPQGANCSPQIADPTVSFMEYKFMKSIIYAVGNFVARKYRNSYS